VAHDSEEKNEFQGVNKDEDNQKEVEPGQGKRGQPTKESIRREGNSQHFE